MCCFNYICICVGNWDYKCVLDPSDAIDTWNCMLRVDYDNNMGV